MPSGPGGHLSCKCGLQVTGSILASGSPCGTEGLWTSLHLCRALVSPRPSSGQDLQVCSDTGDVPRPAELPGHIGTVRRGLLGWANPAGTPSTSILLQKPQLLAGTPRTALLPLGQPQQNAAGHTSARSRALCTPTDAPYCEFFFCMHPSKRRSLGWQRNYPPSALKGKWASGTGNRNSVLEIGTECHKIHHDLRWPLLFYW